MKKHGKYADQADHHQTEAQKKQQIAPHAMLIEEKAKLLRN